MSHPHRNGCHDHKPYRVSMPVADGYFIDGVTRISKMISVPFRQALTCQYTKTDLGKLDAGCSACKWRAVLESA